MTSTSRPDVSTDLGRARDALAAGRLAAALDLAYEVLDAEPSEPEGLHLAGMALAALGRHDAALAVYEKAHGLYPGAEGLACNLAGLLRDRGRNDAAARVYRTLLSHDRDSAEALLGLTLSAAPGATDPSDTHVHALLARDGLDPGRRAALLFAKANRHHWQGNFDAAFLAYREANAGLRNLNPVYDLDADIGAIGAVADGFTRQVFAAAGHWGLDSTVPVFVVGPPRSGKTRLAGLLASHPAVHGAGELRLLQDTAAEIEAKLTPGDEGRQLHRGTIDFRARRFLAELRRRAPDAERIVDTNANNLLLLGFAVLMFPAAPVIHCRRDPADTGLACYAARFAGTQLYSTDLADTGRFLRAGGDLWDHWKAVIPNPVLEVDFDDLDDDPGGVAAQVFAFLDLAAPAAAAPTVGVGIRFRAADYGDHLAPLRAELAASAP